MIANETTLHKRPNDTEINNYRSPLSYHLSHSERTYRLLHTYGYTKNLVLLVLRSNCIYMKRHIQSNNILKWIII